MALGACSSLSLQGHQETLAQWSRWLMKRWRRWVVLLLLRAEVSCCRRLGARGVATISARLSGRKLRQVEASRRKDGSRWRGYTSYTRRCRGMSFTTCTPHHRAYTAMPEPSIMQSNLGSGLISFCASINRRGEGIGAAICMSLSRDCFHTYYTLMSPVRMAPSSRDAACCASSSSRLKSQRC